MDPETGETVPHLLSVSTVRLPRYQVGVDGPGHPDGGSDWRRKPREPGNERGAVATFKPTPIVEALTAKYKSGDAHALSYAIRAGGLVLPLVPRTNKGYDGHGWIRSQGYSIFYDCGIFDIDNPIIPNTKPADKFKNTTESIEHWKAQLSRPALAGFGAYITLKGSRLIAPYATRVYDGDKQEALVRTVMDYLNSLGWTSFGQEVQVDASCSDMTRLMRLPHVVREGTSKLYVSPWLDLSRMSTRDWEPTYVSATATTTSGHKRPRAPRASAPYVCVSDVPADLTHLIPEVSTNTLKSLAHGESRHTAMSACAAALLAKGVPPGAVPAIVVVMGRAMGIEERHLRDDRKYAERTVERWRTGAKDLKGASYLFKHAPDIAAAIDAVPIGMAASLLAEVAGKPIARCPADRIYDTIITDTRAAFAIDGLTVLSHPCGTGKTDAATEIAQESAAGLHPSGRSGKNADFAARTAYVAPAQKNVRDYQRRAWEKRRLPVLRLTSPLSERYEAYDTDSDGQPAKEGDPVCKFFDEVVALCSGGQNAKRIFCDGNGDDEKACPHRATCRAATGAVDHENRPVQLDDGWHSVHPHICLTQARLGVALEHVGKNGKVICDERPELATVFTLTSERLTDTIKALPSFVDDYAKKMVTALKALLGLLNSIEPYEAADLISVIGQAAIDDAREAQDDSDDRSGAPPIRAHNVALARGRLATAKILGDASEVLYVVWKLLQESAEPATLRVVLNQFGEREMHVAWTDRHVRLLLTRASGASVIYDADAHLWEPEYKALIRDDHPPICTVYASDGVPIDRCLILSKLGAKSVVTERGKFKPGLKHVDLVRLAVERAKEDHAQAGVFVTWKALALVMHAAMGVNVSAEWKAIDQEPSYLNPLAQEMRPVLDGLPWRLTPVDVLWYGAVRGNDEHRDKPFCATLGDPIANIHATETVSCHLKTSRDSALTLGVRQARAELGQAQERIRTKRRSTRALGVHIGRGVVGEDCQLVYPDGWEGTRFEVRATGGDKLKAKIEAGKLGGRPQNDRDPVVAEFFARAKAERGRDAVAKEHGVSAKTIDRWAAGAGVPSNVAECARCGIGQIPAIYGSKMGGFCPSGTNSNTLADLPANDAAAAEPPANDTHPEAAGEPSLRRG